MKVTMHNKDDIARKIADSAWAQPDDALCNNMLRVSEALISVGMSFSVFRSLTSFNTMHIPCGEEKNTDITYTQALNEAMAVAGIN